jgi:ABC-type dipeptide/oligopeptide/nickel transport system ATPase subunit
VGIFVNFNEMIWEWAASLPRWQNDLVRRLYEKNSLEADEVEIVIENILCEHGFADKTANIVTLKKEHVPNKMQENTVKITGLKNFKNIAAIEPQHGMEFSSDGLTIIYGENSAGKSSYAKVLKQACRAVDNKTKVHPNIYKTDDIPSTADIHYITNNDESNYITRKVNTPPESLLSSISIFDSDCARIYAQGDNEVVFIPSEFKIFDFLADVQTKLRQELSLRKEQTLQTQPVFNEILDDTKIKTFLNNINVKTKDQEIHKQCTFTAEDESRLQRIEEDLRILLTENPSKIAQEIQRNTRDVAALKKELQSINEQFIPDKIRLFIDAQQRYLDSKATLDVLTQEAFVNQPLSNVGSDPWRNLWEAARTYHTEAYPQENFPNVNNDAKCLLCQQELNEESKTRLSRFEEFISDSLSQEVNQRDLIRKSNIRKLKSIPLENVLSASVLSYLRSENQDLAIEIESCISRALEVQKYLLQAETNQALSIDEVPYFKEYPADDFQSWIEGRTLELKRLQELIQKDNSKELQQERQELLMKQKINSRLKDALLLVKIKRDINNLEKAVKALDTTKLTKKYNELSSVFLTDHFKNEIEKELKQLRCGHILFDVNNRGVKGKTAVKLNLSSKMKVNLSEVLSEGEQKAISLAFFLAESSAMPHKGGLILDDPVSSLDHGRREYVANRLAREAKQRQVIVFTHDIIFLYLLQKHAKLYNVPNSCCTVRRMDKQAGIASTELPWIAQKIKARIGYLKNHIPFLKKKEKSLEPDLYRREVKQWYMYLREAWERAVEELLFQGVIERFNASIKTQSLSDLKITDEMISLVTTGMTKSSAFVHDESPAFGGMIPSIEEIESDLKDLETFKQMFKK